ncbi:cysteine/serine-rich nuclear protein 1-like isoform X1 [Dermacentor albipictus]|uniref:cysteine/serine-rich nuclear protein 1-like isoform X1 n=1 Tax=Dermacentor albipictus TaxID=60249 RepID=UPI0038FCEF72
MAVPVQAQVLPLRKCVIYHQWSRACGPWSILDSQMGGGSAAGRPQRRQPKAVSFDKATVYMFPRVQGFSSVPTRGGDTLGMDFKHTEEYTRILRGFEGQSCRPPGDDLPSETSLFYDATSPLSAAVRWDGAMPQEAGDGDEERSGRHQLEPLQWRRRRQLLRDSGVRSFDFSETIACQAIRTSRERCGCSCIDQCLPETCSCSLNGIACQKLQASCRTSSCIAGFVASLRRDTTFSSMSLVFSSYLKAVITSNSSTDSRRCVKPRISFTFLE